MSENLFAEDVSGRATNLSSDVLLVGGSEHVLIRECAFARSCNMILYLRLQFSTKYIQYIIIISSLRAIE